MARRALLAAALGIAACALKRSGPAPAARQGAPRFPIVIPRMTSAELASFAAFAPGVAPVGFTKAGGPGTASAFSNAAASAGALWQVAAAVPFALPAAGTFAPLEPALRQLNFQPAQLLKGAMSTFAGKGGNLYGIPAFAGPWAVQYDSAAFAQIGLAPPAPNWTIDDFEAACEVITSAIGHGRLPHLRTALGPLVGSYAWPPAPASLPQLDAFGQFNDADLWGAFAVGFGGTVTTAQGAFDFTNAGAVAGLQRMVDIATRYAPPPSAAVVPRAYALGFVATVGVSPNLTGLAFVGGTPRYARFPVLPITAVVPVKVGGFTVLPAADGPFALNLSGATPRNTPPSALLALVEYALWWYARDRQTPALPGLAPPVAADAAVQKAYWAAPGRPPGYGAVGDWRHFSVVETGWPLVPDAVPVALEFRGQQTSPVFNALTQAVRDKVPISRLLPGATLQMNAMRAASAGKGGPTPANG